MCHRFTDKERKNINSLVYFFAERCLYSSNPLCTFAVETKKIIRMSLIKSISGIRGTIGGRVGDNLTPPDIVSLVSAFIAVQRERCPHLNKIVIGRDARISGEMVEMLVTGTCLSMGVDVINIGLATTPTTEIATMEEKALGGIIITASHNPLHWNALKLLNENGEFLNQADGEAVLQKSNLNDTIYANVETIGHVFFKDYTYEHIKKITELRFVDVEAIRKKRFKVVIDAVNSIGGIVVPALLDKLGVETIVRLNCEPTGRFEHNPEPLPEHLIETCRRVKEAHADVGFAVDPDVDRLAIICENGDFFGEEYTLVSVAEYVLSQVAGNTVSNLSSSRALRDITTQRGGLYNAAAVGEVNVVAMMKATNAIIGGEGNGGVILPECHYGRDALVGIALFLTQMARSDKQPSELRKELPNYFLSKNKVILDDNINFATIVQRIKQKYDKEDLTDIDGLKIDFEDGWVHIRKSNTEPILRIYAEAKSQQKADWLAQQIIEEINS